AARGRVRADRAPDAGGPRHAVGGRDRRGRRPLARAVLSAEPLEARGRAATARRQHGLPRGGGQALMIVGMLPPLGGGLRALAATGQAPRLVEGYLRPYVAAFGRVDYFTYAPERLEEFTRDPLLLERVRVLAPARPIPRGVRALTLTTSHAAELAACAALRVFQLTGAVPALLVRARVGVPYVVTYGFWYARLSRPGPTRWLKAALE